MTDTASSNDELIFLALGGCGEIGMNMYLFGYGPPDRQAFLLADVGMSFADERLPGIDIILADPSFIAERADNLVGIVITHGHEDHIGALVRLWPFLRCPVYATPFTAALLRPRISEAGLTEEIPLHIVPLGGKIDLAPFDVELISMTHSIPEPNAMAIRTPLGLVVHSGDWKLDPQPVVGASADIAKLKALGEEGVLALTCDSTNALTPGLSGSELDVQESLAQVIRGRTGRIAVTTFASNVARIHSIAQAAAANDRHVVLVGRAMHRIVDAAEQTGYLPDLASRVSMEEAGYLPPDKILYICTGSQGEPRAALSRIAEDSHPHVVLGKGDTVIYSSKIIPGNETVIFEVQNRLAERGVNVISEKDAFVHVSGHPCRDELKQMYQWLRPQITVPIHGETRHLLAQEELAKECGVSETVFALNGSMVRLAPGPAEVVDRVETGVWALDGELMVSSDDPAIQIRRRLSFSGLVHVILVLDKKGELIEEPRVLSQGVPEALASGEVTLVEELEDRVEDAVETLDRRDRQNDGVLEEAVRRAVRRLTKHDWGKRPLIEVEIIRL